MKLLSLNCHGLGNPETVQELQTLVKVEVPQVVFVMETRLDVRSIEWLRIKLGFHGALGVNRARFGGGLALLWSNEVSVQIQSYSPSHIDAEILPNDGASWRFTGFYGNPDHHRRIESWDLLRRLGSDSFLPWMICGDFNEIVDNGEKLGIRSRPQRQMKIFREALDDCRLEDLGYQGPKFTWCNMQNNEDVVFARLDRGVCTREWLHLFPSTKARIIPFVFSDHHAVIVDCLRTTPSLPERKHHFRFEATWIKRDNCEEVIRSAWAHPQHGTKMFCLCQKIKAYRVALLQWSKQGIFSLPRTIKALKTNLCDIDTHIQENWQDQARLAERNEIRKELNHLISQEEIYWRQRSRISWMKDGDRNTKFFHECASQRKRKNEISYLRNQHGDWVSDKSEMEGIVHNYFHNLFTSSNPVGIPNVVSLVDRVVSDEMNHRLVKDFDAEEVRRALFQIHPTKALGPDGMSAIFFQHFWHIVGRILRKRSWII
jgi:hypothetical protein